MGRRQKYICCYAGVASGGNRLRWAIRRKIVWAKLEKNREDKEQEVETNERCQQLQEGAAKVEQKHGFQDGVSNYDADSNQASHESTVCKFINTLSSGAYDQSGEIVRRSNAAGEDGARATASGQKISLTLVIFGTCAVATYAAQLPNL